MKSLLLPIAALVCLTSCAGGLRPDPRIYVPPSTSKLGTHITSAQEHAARTSDAVKSAAARVLTAKERIKMLQEAVKDQPPILSLAVQLEGDVDVLTGILLSAGAEITALQGQLEAAQGEKAAIQKQVNDQTDLLNKANMERNAAITQGAIDKRNAHKFKAILIIIATLAVGAVMFGLFGMKAFAPPLLWVMLGAPSAVGIFLFFWLGSG